MDWSGSFSRTRSPNVGFEAPGRCLSKREMSVQQMEIRKLKEDVLRLQSQCYSMQMQMQRMLEKKKKGFFRSWKKLGIVPSLKNTVVEKNELDRNIGEGEVGNSGIQTPVDMKTKLVRGKTPPSWRKSMSGM